MTENEIYVSLVLRKALLECPPSPVINKILDLIIEELEKAAITPEKIEEFDHAA